MYIVLERQCFRSTKQFDKITNLVITEKEEDENHKITNLVEKGEKKFRIIALHLQLLFPFFFISHGALPLQLLFPSFVCHPSPHQYPLPLSL